VKALTLVVPTYNERETIEALLRSLAPVLASVDCEIIVADDDSPDGTGAAVRRLAREPGFQGRVKLLTRRNDPGLGLSVVEAFENAEGRALAVMDADGSHDETLLPILLKAVEGGAEVAVGSRRVPGGGADRWPWYRRFTSTAATLFARGLLGLSLRDPMSGFFVLHREVFERSRSRLRPRGYKILLELVVRGKVPADRIVEVPYIFKDRRQGYSKLRPGVVWSLLRQIAGLVRDRWRPGQI